MIASNVAFLTSALSPIALASALARSASMPSIVLPSSPMDSIGGELASDATVSLPLLLTWPAPLPATAELAAPDDALVVVLVLDVVLLSLSPLEPHAASG